MTYHACREEVPGLDVVQGNVAGHLSDRVANCEDGVDLVELIALEVQLFPHTRHIGVVQIGSVKVVEEVHEAAKGEDEEVQLLDQLPLAGGIVLAFEIAHKVVRHGELPRFSFEIDVGTHAVYCSTSNADTADIETLGTPSLYGCGQRHAKGVWCLSETRTRS